MPASAMGSLVVVEVGEAVDEGLDAVDGVGDIVDGVEFVASKRRCSARRRR